MPSCCTSCVCAGCPQPGGRHQHQRGSGCSLRLKVPPGPHTCRSTWPLLLTEGGARPVCGEASQSFTPRGPSSGCCPLSHSRHARGQLGKGRGRELGMAVRLRKMPSGLRGSGIPGSEQKAGDTSATCSTLCDGGNFSLPPFLHLQSGDVTTASFRQIAMLGLVGCSPAEGGGGCRRPLGPLLAPQAQGRVLLLTICAAGIGGTFQFGYNLSIINAPTLVRTLSAHCHHPSVNSGPRHIFRPPSAWWSFLPRLHLHWAVPQALRVQIQLCTLP